MKVIYLNVVDRKAPEVLDVDDKLETYYRLIGCDCIDIVRREIGGNCPLVGNLVICGGTVKDGELTGLTKDETGFILQHIRFSPIAGHYMLFLSA